MKRNHSPEKETNPLKKQGKHCTNEGFGQGRGRNCDYRRGRGLIGSRPVRSIMTTIFDGLNRLIDRSQQTIAMLSSKSAVTNNGGTVTDKLSADRKPRVLEDKLPGERTKQLTNEK